jgi:hypothetical protein
LVDYTILKCYQGNVYGRIRYSGHSGRRLILI